MPFTDDFIPPDRFRSEFRADIDVFLCLSCMTAQTQHDVAVEDYYEDYQYSVGGSATASRFMRQLVHELKATYHLEEPGKKVLEIGSGDGEQLLAFQQAGYRVVGYEPSSELCRVAEAKGIPTIQGLFTADSAKALPADHGRVDVVMLSYTFDHLPQPREFLAAARSILDPDHGLLVVEVHDLEKIFERQEYCLFEHEHSIYLTRDSAARLCALEGLRVVDFNLVTEAERRANSLIFVATPERGALAARLPAAAPRVPDCFGQVQFYEQQAGLIQRGIQRLDRFVADITRSGRRLCGYGAGGRGVMTLAAMRQAGQLRYLVDKKPKGSGLVVPGCGIPLVGLDALRSDPVDDILVFSFGYMREIQQELAALGYRPEQFHSLLDVLGGKLGA